MPPHPSTDLKFAECVTPEDLEPANLPVGEAVGEAAPRPDGGSTDSLSGRTVLFVDDEAFFLTSMVQGMRDLAPGLEVLTASDGIAALEVLDRRPVEIVVTDIHMPRLDGFGLIAELIGRETDVNVIVLSAYGLPNLPEIGSIECLEKPLDFDELLGVLVKTIHRRTNSRLRGVSLFGLLRIIEIERSEAAIRVQSHAQVAWLYVHAGRLVHAKSALGTGVVVATQALQWTEPRVEIHLLPRGCERSMDVSLADVLFDAARVDIMDSGAFDFAPLLSLPVPADQRPAPRPAPTQPPTDAAHLAATNTGNMSNIQESLKKASELSGTLGVALVDYGSGMTLGTHGSGINLDIAAAGNMNVMRAKQNVMTELGIKGGIEDILITLESQYHLIRPIGTTMFLYLAIDRKNGNLAQARLKLGKIAEELEVD
jgi:DNA-binding response OmpR family regulator/predicted regulator of Ras-like GTPase activity (Roadblock/LC7/MglB family)